MARLGAFPDRVRRATGCMCVAVATLACSFYSEGRGSAGVSNESGTDEASSVTDETGTNETGGNCSIPADDTYGECTGACSSCIQILSSRSTCTHPCTQDSDCPAPSCGTAMATCSGQQCSLTCTGGLMCPIGQVCLFGTVCGLP